LKGVPFRYYFVTRESPLMKGTSHTVTEIDPKSSWTDLIEGKMTLNKLTLTLHSPNIVKHILSTKGSCLQNIPNDYMPSSLYENSYFSSSSKRWISLRKKYSTLFSIDLIPLALKNLHRKLSGDHFRISQVFDNKLTENFRRETVGTFMLDLLLDLFFGEEIVSKQSKSRRGLVGTLFRNIQQSWEQNQESSFWNQGQDYVFSSDDRLVKFLRVLKKIEKRSTKKLFDRTQILIFKLSDILTDPQNQKPASTEEIFTETLALLGHGCHLLTETSLKLVNRMDASEGSFLALLKSLFISQNQIEQLSLESRGDVSGFRSRRPLIEFLMDSSRDDLQTIILDEIRTPGIIRKSLSEREVISDFSVSGFKFKSGTSLRVCPAFSKNFRTTQGELDHLSAFGEGMHECPAGPVVLSILELFCIYSAHFFCQ